MKLILLPLWIFRQIAVSVFIVISWICLPLACILSTPEEAIEDLKDMTIDMWTG